MIGRYRGIRSEKLRVSQAETTGLIHIWWDQIDERAPAPKIRQDGTVGQ